MQCPASLKHRLVRFRVRDIYIPDPLEVLNELHGNDILQGKVVDLTDSGAQEKVFVVVEVRILPRIVRFCTLRAGVSFRL
jgi:hypothetical protein